MGLQIEDRPDELHVATPELFTQELHRAVEFSREQGAGHTGNFIACLKSAYHLNQPVTVCNNIVIHIGNNFAARVVQPTVTGEGYTGSIFNDVAYPVCIGEMLFDHIVCCAGPGHIIHDDNFVVLIFHVED